MRRILLWLFCITLSLVPQGGYGRVEHQSTGNIKTAVQSDAKRFLRLADTGAWWSSLSDEQKFDFVDGYVTAMANVHDTSLRLSAQDAKQNANMDVLMNLSVMAELYDYGEDRPKLVSGVDAFYKEPLNTHIGITFALQFVRDTLNGKNAPRDLEKMLSEWRAIVSK